MKNFEEEMRELFGGPLGFSIKFENGYEAYSLLFKHFKDWVSPEDHQNIVASKKVLEKSNLRMSEENAKFVVENIELTKEIAELKSQLEKQQPEIPEVPQSVADFIVGHKFNHYKMVEDFEKMSNDSEIKRWIFDNISTNAHGTDRGLKTLFELINHGYTVAKEKRFYLKNKLTELYLRFDSDDLFYFESADKESSLYKTTFTQQEISGKKSSIFSL